MKIGILDLNHTTRGIHTHTVPLGCGLIATYLKMTIARPLDIKIFKRADRAIETFREWVPDVLALAQYSWNSELNLYVARQVKASNPDCLVVAGGPNLYLSRPYKKKFLEKEKDIDICIDCDGEIPFAEIVSRMLSGATVEDIRNDPVAGAYSLHAASGELVYAGPPPRITSLDIFGTPFADGVFDEFLDDGFHPFVQTHRGCPFKCSFCHTSDPYHSKMLFQSPELFSAEMQYLGKRYAGQHHVTLYMANTNMSLFKEDFEIAEIIRKTQQEYDWPRNINVNSGKNPWKLMEMLSIIDFQPAIALQTLTPEVLANINRKNISFEAFTEFQHEVTRKTGRASTTELILSLPGESRETFLDSVKQTINSGIQNIVIYSLMNLRGTPLSEEGFADRYGYEIKHRVVPRQFSRFEGELVLDTEEIVVGTNTMPYEDYLYLRGVSFVVSIIFGCTELVPLKLLLGQYGVDIAQWTFNVHERLPDYEDLNREFENFMRETEDELFDSREELYRFFDKPENYEALLSGRLGDNLIRKYRLILLVEHYPSMLKLAVEEGRKLLGDAAGADIAESMLDDMHAFLSTRDMKGIFENLDKYSGRQLKLSHDIPAWLVRDERARRLGDFGGEFTYTAELADGIAEKIRNLVNMNENVELALQILYRDGTIRDYWPVIRKA